MSTNRDNFDSITIESLKKRAGFICSNPECKVLTISPSKEDEMKTLYIGKAAHITAASIGGPRYDETLTSHERSAINNAIFLCSNCADMIDKNNGIDFPTELINNWKVKHEEWVRNNLNKSVVPENSPSQIFNVSSINQSGGITAGIVNIGSQPRKLNKKIEDGLIQILSAYKSQTITIMCVLGDSESFNYANEVKEFLIKNGYSINGVNQAVFLQPEKGQSFSPKNLQITIGSK